MWPLIARPSTCSALLGRLVGGVGELHAAGLHPPAREHLGLDDDRLADAHGDLARLLRRGREAEVGDGDPRALDDLARLVLEEPHRRRPGRGASRRPRPARGPWRPASRRGRPSRGTASRSRRPASCRRSCARRAPSGIASMTFLAKATSSGSGEKTFLAMSICTGCSDHAPTQPSRKAARNCVSQPSDVLDVAVGAVEGQDPGRRAGVDHARDRVVPRVLLRAGARRVRRCRGRDPRSPGSPGARRRRAWSSCAARRPGRPGRSSCPACAGWRWRCPRGSSRPARSRGSRGRGSGAPGRPWPPAGRAGDRRSGCPTAPRPWGP